MRTMCKRCDAMYVKDTKFQTICIDCQVKAYEKGQIKRQITYYRRRLNSV
jgi:hypothetical protein